MTEHDKFLGRTAVVTGAASGIGRALAVTLAARGASVAISDVDADGLEGTADLCRGEGRVERYRLDVADRAAVLAHAEEVAGAFGAVHLLFNNAGVAVGGTIEETTFEDFDWLLGINLGGVIHGTKAFLPHLIASGDGHVVNISSVFGLVAPFFNGAYSTAKFGVRGFTECLRQEMLLGGHPVGVHCVHPGGVRTNIVRSARMKPSVKAAAPDRDPVGDFERVLRTSPERAAADILLGVERDRARILIGADARVIDAAARLLGGRYVDLLARAARRAAIRRGRPS